MEGQCFSQRKKSRPTTLFDFIDTKPLLSTKEILTDAYFFSQQIKPSEDLYGWMNYFLYFCILFELESESLFSLSNMGGSYFFKTFTFCGRNKVMVWNNMRMSKGFLCEPSL